MLGHEPQGGKLARNPKVIFRGPANSAIEVPGWCGYMTLRDVEGKASTMPPAGLDAVPVLQGDGGAIKYYWNVGETLAVNMGCGYGDTVWLGASAELTVEVWGTPSDAEGRQEIYDDSARLR